MFGCGILLGCGSIPASSAQIKGNEQGNFPAVFHDGSLPHVCTGPVLGARPALGDAADAGCFGASHLNPEIGGAHRHLLRPEDRPVYVALRLAGVEAPPCHRAQQRRRPVLPWTWDLRISGAHVRGESARCLPSRGDASHLRT